MARCSGGIDAHSGDAEAGRSVFATTDHERSPSGPSLTASTRRSDSVVMLSTGTAVTVTARTEPRGWWARTTAGGRSSGPLTIMGGMVRSGAADGKGDGDEVARPGPVDDGVPDPPDHVLALLDGLQRRLDVDVAVIGEATRHPALRGSHRRLLNLIPAGGCRPTELAARARSTKQALGPRLAELRALGYVEAVADATDRRALVVRRTATGLAATLETLEGIGRLESGWAAEVGADRYATFRAVLGDLVAGAAPDRR